MTWLTLFRSPLVWAAIAALMAWAAWGQFQRAQDARAAIKGYEEAAHVMSRVVLRERERSATLAQSLEELANVPDSNVCVDSGSIRVLPELLRRGRANPG